MRVATRRGAMIGLSALGLRRAGAAPPPSPPKLFVAGPVGGSTDRWAEVLAASLGRSFTGGSPLSRETVGGADGVTGANQFEARGQDDDVTVLLFPGQALLAWLVGDSRVRFQTGRWVPLWGAGLRGALFSRGASAPTEPLRVAVASPGGPELAALLALDLLGTAVQPVRPDAAEADALFVAGPDFEMARARFGAAVFTLGVPGPEGEPVRDPALPEVPTALELVRSRGGALVSAFRAVCAAAGLAQGLVLPLLAPGSVVAWWRQACRVLAEDGDVQSEAARRRQALLSSGALSARMAALNVDAPSLIELRRWLVERYHWRPD